MVQPLIDISYDIAGIFAERKNRFLGVVNVGSSNIYAHIHDPGRLKELLYPGNEVLLKKASSPRRKTKWELIAAKRHGSWILVNSKYHRYIAERILAMHFPGYSIRAEVKIGDSRIDFLATGNERIAIEVKGCTLERQGIALFPDAPTKRGARHVEELLKFTTHGRAMLLILVFVANSMCFLPNEETDPHFSSLFWKALRNGVEVKIPVLKYDGSTVYYLRDINVCENRL